MRMELIQPFINAADAVFAESLQGPTNIVDLNMDENTYRRKGVAALITIQGDIDRIFALASAVEDWPRWLPHYRWVKVLSGDRTDRIVAMAAHRDGLLRGLPGEYPRGAPERRQALRAKAGEARSPV